MSKNFTVVFITLFLILSTASVIAKPKAETSDKWSFITQDSDDLVLPGINPIAVEGNIVTAGSSTVFPLSERMVERFVDAGYDLKLVCRELARAIRDLLVIAIDSSRADDPEISSGESTSGLRRWQFGFRARIFYVRLMFWLVRSMKFSVLLSHATTLRWRCCA